MLKLLFHKKHKKISHLRWDLLCVTSSDTEFHFHSEPPNTYILNTGYRNKGFRIIIFLAFSFPISLLNYCLICHLFNFFFCNFWNCSFFSSLIFIILILIYPQKYIISMYLFYFVCFNFSGFLEVCLFYCLIEFETVWWRLRTQEKFYFFK